MTPHDDLAGYVLDALDADERLTFERHLDGCADCRAGVAELSEVTAELGAFGPGAFGPDAHDPGDSGDADRADVSVPPPGVRASVLQAIARTAQLPPVETDATEADAPSAGPPVSPMPLSSPVSPVSPVPADRVSTHPATAAGSDPVVGVEPVVLATAGADPVTVRRTRRTTRASWIVAAAMAVVVGLSGWVYAAGQRRDAQVAGQQLASAQQSIAAQREAQARFWSAADLRTYSATLADGASATFAVSRSENKALFVSGDLPAPGPGKTYQLWTIRSATDIRPDVLVGGGGAVSTFLSGDVDGVATLAMTIEPAGGSQTPTLPIQAAADI